MKTYIIKLAIITLFVSTGMILETKFSQYKDKNIEQLWNNYNGGY